MDGRNIGVVLMEQIIKKTTVISGQENTVSHVTAPKDIPAVAVEINKSSEVICDKLSEITYTVYTDSDTLHIPVLWDVLAVNSGCGNNWPSKITSNVF